MLDDVILAADHQAEASIEAEHPTAGADVDVVDVLLHERGRSIDVVAVVGVAAVDHDVTGIHPIAELHHRVACERRRHHHPGGSRRSELAHEIVERTRAGDRVTLGGQ